METRVTAGQSGMSKERLKRITRSLEGYVESGEISGAVSLVYRRGEIAHLDVIGQQDHEAARPMQRDTIFRIFSMTKPIMAVAALSLVEETRLRLDDPLDPWLPELANRQVLHNPDGPLDGEVYPAPRPLTLRDLLTYKTGIGWMFNGPVPYEQAARDLSPYPVSLFWSKQDLPGNYSQLAPDEWIKQLEKLPLRYAPGERWMYNVSTDILSVLLARVSGMSLGELLRQRIFEPLGMPDTGFWVPKEKLERLAVGYGTSFRTNEKILVDHSAGSMWAEPPLFESGAGGLVSTVDDYLRFGRMLLNRGELDGVRLLSRKTIEAMTTDYLTPEQHTHAFGSNPDQWKYNGFGFGVAVVTETSLGPGLGAYSWAGGMGTVWVNDPQEEMIYLLMTQRSNFQSKIRLDFTTLVYQAIED